MRFTGTNVPGSSAFPVLLGKELEEVKLCREGKAFSGFTGHMLHSGHWAGLEPEGCVVPCREENWPASGFATSMLCELAPHSDISVLRVCRCHMPVAPWWVYKGSSR